MVLFLQQVVTGISIGGVYALLAVGYSLIYSVFDFTNFAFGSLMMAGAFAGFFAISAFGFPPLWGIAFVVIVGIAVSIFVEVTAYRPLRQKKASRLFLMITAMGVDIFLTNLATVVFGGNLRPFPIEIPLEGIMIEGISVGRLDLFAIIFSIIALLILWFYIEKTKTGLGIRASARDTATAGLMGVNVNKISIAVFVVSGAIAAISGTFFGMKYAVYPTLGAIATKAFIASVIGGMGSLPGAVIGGVILGVLETLVSGYISSTYRDLFAFALMIVTLLFLPNGLMGKKVQDKL